MKTSPLNQLKYPVIRINQHNIMMFDSPNWLTLVGTTNLNYWKNLPRTIVVDVNGNVSRLARLEQQRRSWHPSTWGAKEASLRVRWSIEELPSVTLDELRDTLTEMVVSKRWYTQSWENEEKFRKRIAQAASFKALFMIVNFYGRWIG